MLTVACLCVFLAQPLFEMPPKALDEYLKNLSSTQPDYGRRVTTILRDSLGTPYVGDPLGEGPDGAVDKDPLMDLGHVDCVTFVEQTMAMAATNSGTRALDLLQKIRYRDGKIAYENRNHFMVNDWIAHNTFCRDVSASLGVPTTEVTRTVSRRTFFEKKKLPELGASIPDETKTLTYVPVAGAAEAEKALPSPALVLFIGKLDWLFVLHCGMYVRDEQGHGLVYNASSTEKEVVAIPLQDFFKVTNGEPAKCRYLGFTAYAISDPAKAAPTK